MKTERPSEVDLDTSAKPLSSGLQNTCGSAPGPRLHGLRALLNWGGMERSVWRDSSLLEPRRNPPDSFYFPLNQTETKTWRMKNLDMKHWFALWNTTLQPESVRNVNDLDVILNWRAYSKWDIFFSEQLVAKFLFSSKYIKNIDNAH